MIRRLRVSNEHINIIFNKIRGILCVVIKAIKIKIKKFWNVYVVVIATD
jgi:hypothetical protein